MFNLVDERKTLYQWDLNRQVTVEDETITEVHFANEKSKEALVTEVRDGIADIPNILLQENEKYLYVYGVDINFTKYFEKFPVVSRAKPSDYFYTETEVKDLDNIIERVKELEENGGGGSIDTSVIEEELDTIKGIAEDAVTYSQNAYSNSINIINRVNDLNTKVITANSGIANNNTLIRNNGYSLDLLNTEVEMLNSSLSDNYTAINDVRFNVANQAASLTRVQTSLEEVKNLILALDTGAGSGGSGGDYSNIPDYVYSLKGNLTYKFRADNFSWLLEQAPEKFNGNATDIHSLFLQCQRLKRVPLFENVNFADAANNFSNTFYNCYSLVEIPESFLERIPMNYENSWEGFGSTFYCCYLLKSIKGLTFKEGFTSTDDGTMFYQAFDDTAMLENLEFAYTANNQPQTVNFNGNTLDLSYYVGYSDTTKPFIDNDIPMVTNDSEYETLKNSEYGTLMAQYSHYNHNSAVRTINSLPDTSNYGTNIIKFNGNAGSNTDGGAINTLTQEEIAVATEKGWTVSYV